MGLAGFTQTQIDQLVWLNPTGFFAQSGRLDVRELERPAGAKKRETFEGNSVLRGQDPDRM